MRPRRAVLLGVLIAAALLAMSPLLVTGAGAQDNTTNVSNVTIDPGEIRDPDLLNMTAQVDGKRLIIAVGTHPAQNFTRLAVTAFAQGDRSREFVNESYTSDQARQITRQNSTIADADTVVVQAELSTSNRTEPITRRIYLGDLRTLNVPLDNGTLQVFSLLSIIAVAGLFGGALSAVGGVVVVALAWVLSAIGWLSISPAFLAAAGVIAIFLAAASQTGGIR
jgi:hypothetical protein